MGRNRRRRWDAPLEPKAVPCAATCVFLIEAALVIAVNASEVNLGINELCCLGLLSLLRCCEATFFGQRDLFESAQADAVDEEVDLPRIASAAAMSHTPAGALPSRARGGAARTRIDPPLGWALTAMAALQDGRGRSW